MIYEGRLQADSDSQQRETLSMTLFFSNAQMRQENMLVHISQQHQFWLSNCIWTWFSTTSLKTSQ